MKLKVDWKLLAKFQRMRKNQHSKSVRVYSSLTTHEVVGGINEELSATDQDGWRTEEGWHVLQLPPLLRPNGKDTTLIYISK